MAQKAKEVGAAEKITITPSDIQRLINRAKIGIRQKKSERRQEEPGLTEKARNFVIRF